MAKQRVKPRHIDSYSFGNITVDGKTYSSDLIVYPDRIQENWWRRRGHYLQKEDLIGIEKILCDVLIIGVGASGAMNVAPEVEEWLRHVGIAWEIHHTGRACERFNALVLEGKQVIAALHLTC
jgi:hypothetical protein